MRAVILAAGIGSRLGKPYPKCLNRLPSGESIIQRQVRLFQKCGIEEIVAVVGFKKELIMEHIPNIFYVYNPIYYITNTSKSLLKGIMDIHDDLLWVNGDVIFEEKIIEDMLSRNEGNLIAVNNQKCGEEEVKYSLDANNNIRMISKQVSSANGEAVGINLITAKDINLFKQQLEKCEDNDYFERAMECLINEDVIFKPHYINENKCIEVDFETDWLTACDLFK